ncbi:PREDICTED: RAS guanyl-releasing protein 4 isoform X7 [Miniopterus natalensis]|uniref:RAS guanyl-releasing protein 4 isoform X7 n=1 Tax=Miniopterus natalensis TaxID=291302 RepID=UPI0007A6AAD1|nr:PREDICTED: RAS guanyl-releasing protein 4 isoform X7 [Miniopterus natalensis]
MNRKDSKRKSHQECPGKTGGRGRLRQARRHKTCPSPREISKVMASMALDILKEGSCSEDELLEKCIQSFDSAGSLRRGDHILNMVLAMHSWVLPSAHLAARLLTKYQEATGNTQDLRRLQICHLVRYWLTRHPETVHQEPQLEEAIGRFWATVEQEGNSAQRSLGDSSNLLSPGGPGPPPCMSSPGLGKKCKVSLLFDHLEAGELAQHLTYLEFRSFQSITALLELTELLSAHNNYACYRRTWAGCTGFRLPVLGVHLKDLVSLHEAQPSRLPDDRLHLPKLNSLYLRLQELALLQKQQPPCSANEDLLHLLTLSLDLFYTEDEIYELSYAREPRCPKNLPPSPFKAPLVVEWAPGVTPKPDRATLGRHVEQLVESVFKNYDPEGRGTISLEDFERLSGNFPFACHGLHPPPRQKSGSFSREELTGYLLRASAICSKLGLAFLHTFHEVTFRKPTFCHSCSGFLWGVTKQGYRCRDCGLCCHKHCRDRVKEECKRPGVKGDMSPPGAPVPPRPIPHASCGSEDSLSYTHSLEPEMRCHLHHAWTQTELPHPSWEPQTVRRDSPLSPAGYRGDQLICLENPNRFGEAWEKRCQSP